MINPIGSSQAELPPDEADLGAAGDGEDASAATSVTGLSYDGGSHSSVSHSRLLFGGGVAHASIEGDGGGQTVEVHGGFSGEVNGRGGTDGFVAHAGSTVSDATVRGGAGDDGIVQHAGATFRDVELLGGDGGDMLRLGGHNERVAMDPGDNEEAPDEIVLQDTVTGDLKARDGESWWQKPKDGSEGGLDLVQLMGDWRETGDGYALAGADGETLAELGIEGDADHLENIASYDAATGEMIVQFQAIDPEIKYDSMWAKAAGTVLKYGGVVVGVFAPPVGVAMSVGGQALLTAHAVDNNIDTTGTWVQMGLSAAPFMGAAGGHVGSALNTGYAASQGNVSGALLGGAGFLPAGAFRDAANTAGYSIGAGKLLDEGRFGDAFLYGATAGVSAGLIDADGTVHDGAKFASNLYNGAETVIDGEFDLGTVGALLRHGGQLPGNLGLDDDRDFGATTGLLGGFADGMSYGIESDDGVLGFIEGVGEFAFPQLRSTLDDLDYSAPPDPVDFPDFGGVPMGPGSGANNPDDPESVAQYDESVDVLEAQIQDYEAYHQELDAWKVATIEKFDGSHAPGRFFDEEGFRNYVGASDLDDTQKANFVGTIVSDVASSYVERILPEFYYTLTRQGGFSSGPFLENLEGSGLSSETQRKIRDYASEQGLIEPEPEPEASPEAGEVFLAPPQSLDPWRGVGDASVEFEFL